MMLPEVDLRLQDIGDARVTPKELDSVTLAPSAAAVVSLLAPELNRLGITAFGDTFLGRFGNP